MPNEDTFKYTSFKSYVCLSFAYFLLTYFWDPVPAELVPQLSWSLAKENRILFRDNKVGPEEEFSWKSACEVCMKPFAWSLAKYKLCMVHTPEILPSEAGRSNIQGHSCCIESLRPF